MTYKKIESWQCTDGRVFTWESGARHHQEDIDNSEHANEALEAGKSIADCMRIWAPHHGDMPDVFTRMTKDTPLIISHWQCMDSPGYKVCRFDTDGIFVYGHAGSAWGSYGATVSASDLQRYAENTLGKEMVKP